MEETVLRILAVVAFFVILFVIRAIGRRGDRDHVGHKGQCPRCHGRIPKTVSRCPNCGWSETVTESGEPSQTWTAF